MTEVFAVNIDSLAIADAMHTGAAKYLRDVDELNEAGLTAPR